MAGFYHAPFPLSSDFFPDLYVQTIPWMNLHLGSNRFTACLPGLDPAGLCVTLLCIGFPDLLEERLDEFLVDPILGREHGLNEGFCQFNEAHPLRLCEDPEAPEDLKSLFHRDLPTALLVDEELRFKFLGEDDRLPFPRMKDAGELGNRHLIRDRLPVHPFSTFHFNSPRSSSAFDHEILVYRVRDHEFPDHLPKETQAPDAGEGDNRPSIGDDHTPSPRFISLASSCFSSSGLIRMAGTL